MEKKENKVKNLGGRPPKKDFEKLVQIRFGLPRLISKKWTNSLIRKTIEDIHFGVAELVYKDNVIRESEVIKTTVPIVLPSEVDVRSLPSGEYKSIELGNLNIKTDNSDFEKGIDDVYGG